MRKHWLINWRWMTNIIPTPTFLGSAQNIVSFPGINRLVCCSNHDANSRSDRSPESTVSVWFKPCRSKQMKHIARSIRSFFGSAEILSIALAIPVWYAGIHYGSPYAKQAWNDGVRYSTPYAMSAWSACINRIHHPVPIANAAPASQMPATTIVNLSEPEVNTFDLDTSSALNGDLPAVDIATIPSRNVVSLTITGKIKKNPFSITPYCSSCGT